MNNQHNPKHIQAMKDGKAPLEYLVSTMDELDAAVHKHGADKYGKFNWRLDKILATTYVGAMRRHLKAWIEGQDLDPDSGKPHLTHLRACCAVVLDAQMHGTLIDDRLRMESKSELPLAASTIEEELAGIADQVEHGTLHLAGWPAPRCVFCMCQPCKCLPIG